MIAPVSFKQGKNPFIIPNIELTTIKPVPKIIPKSKPSEDDTLEPKKVDIKPNSKPSQKDTEKPKINNKKPRSISTIIKKPKSKSKSKIVSVREKSKSTDKNPTVLKDEELTPSEKVTKPGKVVKINPS